MGSSQNQAGSDVNDVVQGTQTVTQTRNQQIGRAANGGQDVANSGSGGMSNVRDYHARSLGSRFSHLEVMEDIEEMVKETGRGVGGDCAAKIESTSQRDTVGKGKAITSEKITLIQQNKTAVTLGEKAVLRASTPSLLEARSRF